MSEIEELKLVFVEFFDKLLPTIPDPMFIIGQRWSLFKALILDSKITIKDLQNHVAQLKVGNVKREEPTVPRNRKLSLENDPVNEEIFQPETYFKINMPNKNLFVKQSSSRKVIDFKEKKKSPLRPESQTKLQQQESAKQETIKLDMKSIRKSPRIPSKFQIFFQIQQNKGFSTVAKEFLLDDIQQALSEFSKHTRTMDCIEQKSFEINTSELNEVDKKLNGQNYGFSTYAQQNGYAQKSFKHISIIERKKVDQNI